MNIHEYQAKELLAKFGVAVPKGIAAMTVEEAVAAARQLPGPLYVVKSQIHAGGRGKVFRRDIKLLSVSSLKILQLLQVLLREGS